MQSSKTIDLDQINQSERAAMLLSTAYTDFKSWSTRVCHDDASGDPAGVGRLGFHEIEP
jgi:hypothetical protein